MIHHASKMIAVFLVLHEVIDEKDMEIYVYGYEALLSGIIDIIIAFSIGLLFNDLLKITVFLIEFVSVRLYTGGYHANTYLKCKLLFSAIVISVVIMTRFEYPSIFALFIILVFILMVFRFTPIENKNKPLTEEQKYEYRRLSRMLSIGWSSVAVLSYFYNRTISNTIIYTAAFIVILMVAEILRKEVLNDEKT